MGEHMTVAREPDFSYEIVWEHNFDRLAAHIQSFQPSGKKACIVSDSVVAPLYASEVFQQLKQLFDTVTIFTFPSGEESKTLDTVRSLYTHLIEHRFERKDLLIALGGGVVGDLTGYTAATYLRGIDFVQIPTTLLSQVDSSIGGKTGVDFDQYKNMVGAFHQPRLVYMCMKVFETLSDRQFSCGMGEVLKTGLIRNRDYYQWILEHHKQILAKDSTYLIPMIQGSCKIKKTVVEHDPHEKGERAVLNLGHTIGHAVEKLMNFKLLHGECVALGTTAAAYLSWKRGMITQKDLLLIEQGNTLYHLSNKMKFMSVTDLVTATKSDKKMEQGKVKFILLDGLGNGIIDHTVTDAELKDAITYIMEKEK